MLKTNFAVSSTIESTWSDGPVAVLRSTECEFPILLTSYGSTLKSSLGDVELPSTITSIAVSPNHSLIALTTMDHVLYIYTPTLKCLHKINTRHQSAVLALVFDSSSTLIATGSADSTIKVYDVKGGYQTHIFKGHSGVISALCFHPSELILASGADDCKIRLWDLKKKQGIAILESHVSVVRGLSFGSKGEYLYSSARDGMLIKWTLESFEAIYESVVGEVLEAVVVAIINGVEKVIVGGEGGELKVYDNSGELVSSLPREGQAGITGLLYSSPHLVVLTSEQNILVYDLESDMKLERQIAGYNQEILDMVHIEDRLAVLTNTSQIRVYDFPTQNCLIVYGHNDIILSLSKSRDNKLLLSGSKDSSAILWTVDFTREKPIVKEIAFQGHTGPVSAVLIISDTLFVTASQDRTIKTWSRNGRAKFTYQAHENDIQHLELSPDSQSYVSSSLDKSIKRWSLTGLLLGTFLGHKRGVWKTSFAPLDQVLVSCSTDKSIRVWNARDYTCLRTIEGHLNSVLSVKVICSGLQIVSTGADGLMKLWDMQGECEGTFDNHDDRVWCLAMDDNQSTFYTGSSDSKITIWTDCSISDKKEKDEKLEEMGKREEDLALFLQRGEFRNALILSLSLEMSYRMLKIFEKVLKENKSSTIEEVDEFVSSLTGKDLERLLTYVRDWNTHSKHSRVAQHIINLVLKANHPELLMDLPKGLLDALVSYSERHLEHAKDLIKENCLVEYTLQRMDSLI